MASPTKQSEKPIFRTNSRLEAPLPPFCLRTTFRISAITPTSPLIKKVHHPAIESLVLSLQCGKATTVFSSSRDWEFVAEVGKCGSRLLDLFFLVLLPRVFLLLLHRCAVLVRASIYIKKLVLCNVFPSSTAVNTHYFFCPHLFVF